MWVSQVLPNIFCQRQLVLQSKSFLAVLATFLQIHTSFRMDIGQLIFSFEDLDFRIHISQFFFNNNQAVIDKIRCIDHHLILVAYRILVVNSNQCIQHILCTGCRNVLQ